MIFLKEDLFCVAVLKKGAREFVRPRSVILAHIKINEIIPPIIPKSVGLNICKSSKL